MLKHDELIYHSRDDFFDFLFYANANANFWHNLESIVIFENFYIYCYFIILLF